MFAYNFVSLENELLLTHPKFAKLTQSSVIILRILISSSVGIALTNSSFAIGNKYCNSSAWLVPFRMNTTIEIVTVPDIQRMTNGFITVKILSATLENFRKTRCTLVGK